MNKQRKQRAVRDIACAHLNGLADFLDADIAWLRRAYRGARWAEEKVARLESLKAVVLLAKKGVFGA